MIEGAGARLVVVTPQAAARAAVWRDELSLGGALVIADPQRVLYQALGARRPKPLWVLRPRVASIGAHLVGQVVVNPIDPRHRGILPPEVWGDGDPEGVGRPTCT